MKTIAFWFCRVRNSIRTYVGDLDVAAVACGLGRAIGNKVTSSFSKFHKRVYFSMFDINL